jgi:hypothetical protein
MTPALEIAARPEDQVQLGTEDLTRSSSFGTAFTRAQNLFQPDKHGMVRVLIDDYISVFGDLKFTIRVEIYRSAEPKIAEKLDLRSTIDRIRRSTTLPVNDVAAMAGLKRRSLYKIINDNKTAAKTESWIYILGDMVSQLVARFHEPELVRAALLTPIPEFDGSSLVQVASEREKDRLDQALERLMSDAGRSSVDRHWRRTRPLTRSGDAARAFIQESVHREETSED